MRIWSESSRVMVLTSFETGPLVGRLRRDYSQSCTLNLWIVADNLRKGAATNAVQIAEAVHQFVA